MGLLKIANYHHMTTQAVFFFSKLEGGFPPEMSPIFCQDGGGSRISREKIIRNAKELCMCIRLIIRINRYNSHYMAQSHTQLKLYVNPGIIPPIFFPCGAFAKKKQIFCTFSCAHNRTPCEENFGQFFKKSPPPPDFKMKKNKLQIGMLKRVLFMHLE